MMDEATIRQLAHLQALIAETEAVKARIIGMQIHNEDSRNHRKFTPDDFYSKAAKQILEAQVDMGAALQKAIDDIESQTK